MARDPFSSSFYLGQNGQKSTENYMNHKASEVVVMGESFISIHAYSLKPGYVGTFCHCYQFYDKKAKKGGYKR